MREGPFKDVNYDAMLPSEREWNMSYDWGLVRASSGPALSEDEEKNQPLVLGYRYGIKKSLIILPEEEYHE